MRLTYIGGIDSVDVPLEYGGEVTVARGETADFPDELAQRMLEQSDIWKLADAPKAKAKKAGDAGEEG